MQKAQYWINISLIHTEMLWQPQLKTATQVVTLSIMNLGSKY